MEKLKKTVKALFCHSTLFTVLASLPVFAAVIYVLYSKQDNTPTVYIIYVLSAYMLTCCCFSSRNVIKQIKALKHSFKHNIKLVSKLRSLPLFERCLDNRSFRGAAAIYTGLAADTVYTVFRAVTGIIYGSVWFITLALYHGVLGVIKLYLAFCYNNTQKYGNEHKRVRELSCYRLTGILLLVLNIPMCAEIVLMIKTNSGFLYPDYIIYLSAMYTFYTAIMAVVNIIRYRKIGNAVLSAAKAVGFVSALMSLLGLQTAMIALFSSQGEEFRTVMNTATGTGVSVLTVSSAVYMIVRSQMILKKQKGR